MGGFPDFFKLSAIPISDPSKDCHCSSLTTLASPDPAELSAIEVGDRLKVVASKATLALHVLNKDGNICGSVLTSINRIRSCMEEGIEFEAKVIILNGAECQVLVQNV